MEQWLIKLQGSLMNIPAFPELPSDMMKRGFLAFQRVKKRALQNWWCRVKGTPLNYCQGVSDNVSQARLADFLIPGAPGPSPRCGASGIPPSWWVISSSFGLAGTTSTNLPLPVMVDWLGPHQGPRSSALRKWEVNHLRWSLRAGMADVPGWLDHASEPYTDCPPPCPTETP